MTLQLKGSIPANALPFDADLEIDEIQYRRHLSWLVDAERAGLRRSLYEAALIETAEVA